MATALAGCGGGDNSSSDQAASTSAGGSSPTTGPASSSSTVGQAPASTTAPTAGSSQPPKTIVVVCGGGTVDLFDADTGEVVDQAAIPKFETSDRSTGQIIQGDGTFKIMGSTAAVCGSDLGIWSKDYAAVAGVYTYTNGEQRPAYVEEDNRITVVGTPPDPNRFLNARQYTIQHVSFRPGTDELWWIEADTGGPVTVKNSNGQEVDFVGDIGERHDTRLLFDTDGTPLLYEPVFGAIYRPDGSRRDGNSGTFYVKQGERPSTNYILPDYPVLAPDGRSAFLAIAPPSTVLSLWLMPADKSEPTKVHEYTDTVGTTRHVIYFGPPNAGTADEATTSQTLDTGVRKGVECALAQPRRADC